MRGLIVFLLCCFQFLAPSASYGNDIGHKHAAKWNHSCDQSLQQASLEHNDFADLSSTLQIFSHHQVRNQSAVKDLIVSSALHQHYGFVECIQFSEGHTFCTPIGLILIFPQHYFW